MCLMHFWANRRNECRGWREVEVEADNGAGNRMLVELFKYLKIH